MGLLFGAMLEFFNSMPPRPDDADNPLRVMLCTPIPENYTAFKERFGIQDLYTAYGIKETSCIFMTQGPELNPKSCGKIFPGVQVRLVDDHDIPVPTGKAGELIIRTDLPWQLNVGYWQRPEQTAEAWRNGWFHTGDLLRCDEDGNYFFVDRKKDAVRRRGENISTFEVEREVLAYPGVLEAACVAAPGDFGEDEVKVFVVPVEGHSIDPAELTKFLIPRMPYFMVPRFIEVIPELPKTTNMRVKKHELRARGNTTATWDREAAGIKVKRDT